MYAWLGWDGLQLTFRVLPAVAHDCGTSFKSGLKMDWVPNEASLGQVVELLKESHSPDTDTQRLVEQVSNYFTPRQDMFFYSYHGTLRRGATASRCSQSISRLQQLLDVCVHQDER